MDDIDYEEALRYVLENRGWCEDNGINYARPDEERAKTLVCEEIDNGMLVQSSLGLLLRKRI